MHDSDSIRRAAFRAGALISMVLAAAAATPRAPQSPGRLPAIVFVSRNPIPDAPGAIPGLGPHHRAVVTGGRLLVREPDGRVRELLPPGTFFDVSDPSVSRDARRVAFAAVQHPDNAWRIWVVGVDGGGLRQITFDEDNLRLWVARRSARRIEAYPDRYHDLDPCWIDDSTLVIASTRYPQRAQYADVPVTNLFTVRAYSIASNLPSRITAERNGAEEPAMDWSTGRLVFSRWWFNRYLAANMPAGITTDAVAAIPRDTVNLWQTMELSLSDHRFRLAGGDLRTRRGSMGYQPTVLPDGSIAAVYAANLGLSPTPGGTGIHLLPTRFSRARRLAGALVSGRAGDVYGGTEGLAPPSACSPAALPDGRVLFSYASGARGDFGLYIMKSNGSAITRVLDLPNTLELDAAPVVRRARPPREQPLAADDREDPVGPMGEIPAVQLGRGTFRYHALDVFADGPPGSPTRGAAPRTPGARIRFFRTVSRPEVEGGDSAFLVRDVPVGPRGEVNERGLPADVPMFEQLVDSTGRVLMTAHGPAHVAGSNPGVAARASRCVGCHLGHSTLPVPSRPMTRTRMPR